jgi:hypothetical protein
MKIRVQGLPELPKLSTLNLNGDRYYELPDHSVVPSVTTMLGHYEKAGLRRWKAKVGQEEAKRISEEARWRGEAFHKAVEHYFDTGWASHMEPKLIEMLPELDKINNIHYMETCLYSRGLYLAGRCDLIAEYDGVLSVIDFKTSRKLKEEKWIQHYFEQGTAYAIMYEELVGVPINQVVIMISSDAIAVPQVFVKDKKDYMDSLMRKIDDYPNIAA